MRLANHIVSIFLLLIISVSGFSQTNITIVDSIDVIHLFTLKINEVDKILGKPSKIERDPFTQPFCGVTAGRDETLIYKKYKLSIQTRKKTGYEKRANLRKWKKKKYYKDCSVLLVKLSKDSKLFIDSISLDSINQTNVDNKMMNLSIKLDENKFKIKSSENFEFVLIFSFDKEGEVKELAISRSYI